MNDKEREEFMSIKMINIGFGNIVSANRIISEARDKGLLIDATYGRKTRAVIVTDSSHVILSAIQPETVANRFNPGTEEMEPQ